ncbi:MAG: 16S rRNA (adenine(1518)-N(6)/adenine(1519)-N(6))-dimethyltransferase [Planctomycetes bacterium]|jgi:16S rRNA (adenine1518-N6/adenine1519-N6)-dimethyltransferase|nr:16S rRNA (adenine(1518)-N(6)/adenine(1519)-N(6))-dimethyltransferase [Planctomycetota bacterium]MCL4731590.1 16S rRNA (adenine(1518)-N(6)/adenine(1519)-N(6))-dimethyltransferase [Planctomycetota bacterium]
MPEPLKLQDIKQRMASFGLRPHKKFGQNFLADFNLLRAIVADAEVDAGDCVLEIGTGAGSLTGLLCDAAGLVISVEVDRGMFEFARDVLEGCTNLVQVRCDALARSGLNPALEDLLRGYLTTGELVTATDSAAGEFELVPHLPGKAPRCGNLKLVANLPYSVATAILFALLESRLPFERMVVMLQHEVGEKLAARPGDPAWGLPGLLMSRLGKVRMIRKVPARVFWPKPRVDSALVEIRPHPEVDMVAFARLRALAHVLFQNRRKSVSNALALALGVSNAQAATWLINLGARPADRTEDLAPDIVRALADHPEIEPLVRKAHNRSAEQILARAEKKARRAAWKKRVYGEEE